MILSLLKMSSLSDSSAPESIPESSEPTSSRKDQKETTISTWKHAHAPHNNEPAMKSRDHIFYCKYCKNLS
jgi:hypothetical protein